LSIYLDITAFFGIVSGFKGSFLDEIDEINEGGIGTASVFNRWFRTSTIDICIFTSTSLK